MSQSDTPLGTYLVLAGAVLVLAGAGGLVFFVAQERHVREVEEQRAMKQEYDDLRGSLEHYATDVVSILEERESLSAEALAALDAREDILKLIQTGGHPVNSRGHLAFIRKLKAETEEDLRRLSDEHQRKFGTPLE